jgi:polyhydroxybutyrate depolymerase
MVKPQTHIRYWLVAAFSVVFSIVVSVLVGYSHTVAAKIVPPSPPQITRIDSIQKSKTTYDLQIYFSVASNGNSTSKASLISTLVSASGKTCNANVGKQSCTIQGLTKNATVNISAKSKNAGGFGLPSLTVRYKVGSSSWTVASQTPATTTKVALRPYSEFVPSSYSSKSPAPLVVLLHGYGSSGKQQETYMNFTAVAEQRGFILAYPDGTVDATGKQFWNATEVCCNFFSEVDDDAYLISMLNDMESKYSIDRKRIYFVGHSNGGFMSYRMACKHSDRIAAIASLAGATFINSSDCAAKDPVSVLQVHGTSDTTILYDGGSILGRQYPSATASATQWATFDRCSNNAVPRADKLDLVTTITGSETSITSWNNCRNGTEVELWTVDQGAHTPALSTTFANKVYDFFASHPKS